MDLLKVIVGNDVYNIIDEYSRTFIIYGKIGHTCSFKKNNKLIEYLISTASKCIHKNSLNLDLHECYNFHYHNDSTQLIHSDIIDYYLLFKPADHTIKLIPNDMKTIILCDVVLHPAVAIIFLPYKSNDFILEENFDYIILPISL